MTVASKIRLNLGARETTIPGFDNMDIDKHPGVKYVGDISDLSRFEDGTVSEIYASHCLEHFPHTQTEDVLDEWYRVLEDGGMLMVAVPDFFRCVQLYIKTGLNQWVIDYLWGGQEYKTAFHYAGFDQNKMTKLLEDVGFSKIKRVKDFELADDCSSQVSTHDREPVSLNMVAIK